MLVLNNSYYIVKGNNHNLDYINLNEAFRLIDIDKDGLCFDGIGMDILFPLDESYYEEWFPEINDYVIDLTSINDESFNIHKIINLDIDKNEYKIKNKTLKKDEIQPYYGFVPRIPKLTNYNNYNSLDCHKKNKNIME